MLLFCSTVAYVDGDDDRPTCVSPMSVEYRIGYYRATFKPQIVGGRSHSPSPPSPPIHHPFFPLEVAP